MIMSNIPRRKIYEELLIFEEGILEIDRMLYSKENIEIYKKELPEYMKKIQISYYNIKILLVLFFDNKQFENEQDFENTISYFKKNKSEINMYFKKNKILKKSFMENCKYIENNIEEINIENISNFLIYLDKFNSDIPKLLEIQRKI